MDTSSDDGGEDHKRPSIIPKAGMCVSLAFEEGRCDGVICEVGEGVDGSGFALSVAFEDDKYVETNVSYPEKDDCELQFVYDSNDNIKTTTVPDGWSVWNYYRDRIESIVNGVKVVKQVKSSCRGAGNGLTADEIDYLRNIISYCKTADEIRACLSRELTAHSAQKFSDYQVRTASDMGKDSLINKISKVEMVLRKFGALPRTTQNIQDKHRALIDTESLNADAEAWSKNMVALCQYVFDNGDCLVPQKNKGLGRWVSTVRYDHTQSEGSGRLMSQRRADLDALGFVWNAHDHAWNVRISQLEEFKAIFGHCNVPQDYPLIPELGTWVNNIRNAYNGRNGEE